MTNVDEPETKEKEEELLTSEGGKPTFICAIYRRDILSFLPRTKIEEMRTLSQRWNYDIITTSSDYLPRIVYPSMEVFVVSCSVFSLLPAWLWCRNTAIGFRARNAATD